MAYFSADRACQGDKLFKVVLAVQTDQAQELQKVLKAQKQHLKQLRVLCQALLDQKVDFGPCLSLHHSTTPCS